MRLELNQRFEPDQHPLLYVVVAPDGSTIYDPTNDGELHDLFNTMYVGDFDSASYRKRS